MAATIMHSNIQGTEEVTLTTLRCLGQFLLQRVACKKVESNVVVDVLHILNEGMVSCLCFFDCLTVYIILLIQRNAS